MKITIIAVGKWKQCPEYDLFTTYTKRCGWDITLCEVMEKKPLPEQHLKDRECDLITAQIPTGATVIALDERGKNLTSPQLAEKISTWQSGGVSSLAFVIGGAFGLSETLRQRADLVLSFGALTYPHMLVRPLIAEQLYRCESIIKGHPYHKI